MDFSSYRKKIDEIKRSSVVVSPVGGKGSRMLPPGVVKGLEKEVYTIKALIPVAGKTLIERFIEEYKSAGINRFVFLLGNGGEEIENYLNARQIDNVEIKYSYDPPVKNVGKGKALKYAFDNGVIPKEGYMYYGFPDDAILYPYWLEEATMRFAFFEERSDIVGLIVFVNKIKSAYGTAEIRDNLVVHFVEKPVIKMNINTGRGIFNIEKLLPYLDLIDINCPKSVEFEQAVLPKIAEDGKLAAYILPGDDWISINTQKELKKAEELLYQF